MMFMTDTFRKAFLLSFLLNISIFIFAGYSLLTPHTYSDWTRIIFYSIILEISRLITPSLTLIFISAKLGYHQELLKVRDEVDADIKEHLR